MIRIGTDEGGRAGVVRSDGPVGVETLLSRALSILFSCGVAERRLHNSGETPLPLRPVRLAARVQPITRASLGKDDLCGRTQGNESSNMVGAQRPRNLSLGGPLGGSPDSYIIHDLRDCHTVVVIAGSRTAGNDKPQLAALLVRQFVETGAAG
jgi:hypothetical protein